MAGRRLNKFEQAGIIAFFAILAVVLYNIKVYKPELKRFRAMREKWGVISSEVLLLREDYGKEALFSAIRKERKKLQEVRSKLNEVSDLLVADNELAGVLTRINRIASTHNLKIRDFSRLDNAMTGGIVKDKDTARKATSSYQRLLKVKDFMKKGSKKKGSAITKRETTPAATSTWGMECGLHSMEMAGSYTNLKGFFSELFQIPKRVSIENIVVERTSERGPLKISLLLGI